MLELHPLLYCGGSNAIPASVVFQVKGRKWILRETKRKGIIRRYWVNVFFGPTPTPRLGEMMRMKPPPHSSSKKRKEIKDPGRFRLRTRRIRAQSIRSGTRASHVADTSTALVHPPNDIDKYQL